MIVAPEKWFSRFGRLAAATEWAPRLVAEFPSTIHAKLLAGFLVIVLLLVTLGAVGLEVLGQANRNAEDLVRQQQRIAAFRQFQRDTTLPPSWAWNEATYAKTLRQLGEFRYELDQLQFVAINDAEPLNRLGEDYDRFIDVVGKIVALIRAGNVDGAKDLQLAQAGPLAARIERLTNDLVNKAEADMAASLDSSRSTYASSRLIVIGFAVGSIALALALGYAISWALIGPVKLMDAQLKRVASGDFSHRLSIPNRDELGALGREFNHMAAQLQESYATLQDRTHALTKAVEELKALGEVGRAVSSTLDMETVLQTIVTRSVQLSGTNAGAIWEYDEATQEFRLRATHQVEEDLVHMLRMDPIRLGEGATGRAAATGIPVQITDIRNKSEYGLARIQAILDRRGYRALLSVPLIVEQRIVGGLTVLRLKSGSFPAETVNLLTTFASQSALAIQNAKLFREIQEKSAQLEVANMHKSDFLANMSHELRTPLNAIIGFSEALMDRMFGDLTEKQLEYQKDIHESGKHLLSLINDILDLSKIEAGRMELELSKFHLPTAVSNAVTLIRERAMRHGISLGVEVDPRLGDFQADERKVKQILLNLLSNAVKFTPDGGRVDVSAKLNTDKIEIAVKDTGVGISPEDQASLFEEFKQLGKDSSRKAEGTGLGLALTKRLVELHGGQILVESAVGHGSTFRVTLPV
jgi:signal transduction histidine kinase/HAMP domain-containing protein